MNFTVGQMVMIRRVKDEKTPHQYVGKIGIIKEINAQESEFPIKVVFDTHIPYSEKLSDGSGYTYIFAECELISTTGYNQKDYMKLCGVELND
jgi:hypothetical protein